MRFRDLRGLRADLASQDQSKGSSVYPQPFLYLLSLRLVLHQQHTTFFSLPFITKVPIEVLDLPSTPAEFWLS